MPYFSKKIIILIGTGISEEFAGATPFVPWHDIPFMELG